MSVVGAFVEDEAGAVTAEGTWALVVLSHSLNMLTGGSHRRRVSRSFSACVKQKEILIVALHELNLESALRGFDDRGELQQQPIAQALDDAPAVCGNRGID
jgi:hypothetical protein